MSKNILEASLEGAEHIVLLGHIHPDGDCIGTTLGLLNYLRENYPQIEAELFLDHPAAKFSYMNDFEKIHTEIVPEKQFDLCITLDASDKERLGGYAVYFDSAAKTLCIDHHRTNTGFAEQNYIIPDASSCSEVLYTLLDEAKISREAAECLYTGIVHDTGVFKYKVSVRSNDYVDVSKVAAYFGGGGHIHAAGCTMQGHPRDVINNLTGHIEKQMDARREE